MRTLDAYARLVAGLDEQHFRLYDNPVEQVITHFTFEEAPVSVGIAFDASGSMIEKIQILSKRA